MLELYCWIFKLCAHNKKTSRTLIYRKNIKATTIVAKANIPKAKQAATITTLGGSFFPEKREILIKNCNFPIIKLPPPKLI